MARVRQVLGTAAAAAGLLTTTWLIGAPSASAHGYVSGPYSRAAACKLGLNTGCGSLAYEPQSLEAPKGFPVAGPADGRIASAGGAFPELDAQTASRWYKNAVSTGPITLDWTYTAAHRTSQWRYYLTKQDWNPDTPIKRSDLELIGTIAHDGSAASTNIRHTVVLPSNRSGYHVLLAVWDVADTANAFYNVIDLNVANASATTSPPAPTASATASATPTPKPPITPTPTTTPTPTASVTPAPRPTGSAPAWNPRARYRTGDRVSYGGRVYRCIQGYQGWGDPNWINAPSLWSPA